MANQRRVVREAHGKKDRGALPRFRPTAMATSVALVLAGTPPALADDFRTNVELFVKPGDDRDYVGVEALVPFIRNRQSLWFADIKANVSSGSSNEFNLGVGRRWLNQDEKWSLGGYLAWDRRRSRNGNNFNQGTLGVEALSHNWDFRVNYYHPIDDEGELLETTGDAEFQGYKVFRDGVYEEPMGGADAEIGWRLPAAVEARIFLAGYRFEGVEDGPTATGARFRAEYRPRKNLAFGIAVQDDDVFDKVSFLEVRYSFGQRNEQGVRSLRERMIDPWQRDIDIVVSPSFVVNNSEEVFSNMVHVDNSYTGGEEDGTHERPYTSFSTCYAELCNDSRGVRVWQGDSTTTPYDADVTLASNQLIWGEGYDIFSRVRSDDRMPVMDAGGGTGFTLNNGGKIHGMQIDNAGTAISGTDISGRVAVTGNLINADTAIDIQSVDIASTLNFSAAQNDLNVTTRGIRILQEVNGSENARQNILIHDNSIYGASDRGIETNNWIKGNATGTQSITVRDNTVSGAGQAFYSYNLARTPGAAETAIANQTLDIRGNTLTSSDNRGMYLANWVYDNSGNHEGNAQTNLTATISNNTINADRNGIQTAEWASGNASTGPVNLSGTSSVTISNNSITAGDYGVRGYIYNLSSYGAVTNQQATLNLTGNVVDAGDMGIYFYGNHSVNGYGVDSNQQTNLTISNNTIDAYYNGVSFASETDVYDAGTVSTRNTVTVSNNTINSYDGTGLRIREDAYDYGSAYSGSTHLQLTANVSGNTITSTYGRGVDIRSDIDGEYADISHQQSINLSGNTINSDNDAVRVRGDHYLYGSSLASSSSVNIRNNTLVSSNGDGIELRENVDGYYSEIDINQVLNISNNTIDSDERGVNIRHSFEGDGLTLTHNQTATITDNTIDSDDNDGLRFRNNIYGGYSNDLSSTQAITISGNNITSYDDALNFSSLAVSDYGGSINKSLSLIIRDNTLTSHDDAGLRIDSGVYGGGGTDIQHSANINIRDNTISAYWNALDISSFASSDYNANISSTQSITLTNNQATSLYSSALRFYGSGSILDGSTGSVQQNISISGGTYTAQDDHATGIAIIGEGDKEDDDSLVTQTISISGSNVTSGGTGIEIRSFAGNDGGGLEQETVISGNTVTASGDAAIALYNASSGGLSSQNVEVRNNHLDGGASGVGITATNLTGGLSKYVDDAFAEQTLTLSGNTITTQDNPGIVIYNLAESVEHKYGGGAAAGNAVQQLSISGNTLDGGGILLTNLANADEAGADAEQTGSIANNSVTNAETGLGIENRAESYESTANANQTLTVSGNTLNSQNDAVQIYNDLFGAYYGSSIGSQSINLQNNTLTGATGSGIVAEHFVGDDGLGSASGAQTVDASGNTIAASVYGVLVDGNDADQTVTLTNNTIDAATDALNEGAGTCTIDGDDCDTP